MLPAPRCRLQARRHLVLAIGLALAAAGCGKKGPPLAPIVRVPAAVDRLVATRVGNEVFLTVTIPSENIDESTPAALRRVDVYAYTGVQAPGQRMMAAATLIASIPVAEVRLDDRDQPLPVTPEDGETTQGAVVTVRDVLTAEARTPRPLPVLTTRRGAAPLPLVLPASDAPQVPQRYYTAIAVSPRERTSPGGVVVGVPLGPIPDPPSSLLAEYPPQAIRLSWEPAGGLIGFLLDRELGAEVSPVDEPLVGRTDALSAPVAPTRDSAIAPTRDTASAPTRDSAIAPTGDSPLAPTRDNTIAPDTLPPGPTRYNVYRETAPDPLVLPDPVARGAWQSDPPLPQNAEPLAALTFEEPLAFDGRERCYHVRAVRGLGGEAVYSEPTPRICVTPLDRQEPEPPTGLTAEALDGEITLLWDPNVEEDLAGYLILRGVAGDATLALTELTMLTERPVATARYVDRTVTPGTRYVYAVVAVDDRVPLGNRSGESNRVDVTAR